MGKICFIGGGNMAYAMAAALHGKSQNSSIGLFEINEERIELFRESFDNLSVYNSIDNLLEESNCTVIAVKPQVIDSVLDRCKNYSGVLISIAAGISIEYISSKANNAKVVRVMPNTPSMVGEMAAGVTMPDNLTEDEYRTVTDFLSASGSFIEVPEEKMDIVTGISGSGPAFAARIMQYFINAGVEGGLTEDQSRTLTLKTFLGTAKLIGDKQMDIDNLINMVSSPGGTTVAGRSVLEASDMSDIVKATVNKTVARSKELGKKC